MSVNDLMRQLRDGASEAPVQRQQHCEAAGCRLPDSINGWFSFHRFADPEKTQHVTLKLSHLGWLWEVMTRLRDYSHKGDWRLMAATALEAAGHGRMAPHATEEREMYVMRLHLFAHYFVGNNEECPTSPIEPQGRKWLKHRKDHHEKHDAQPDGR